MPAVQHNSTQQHKTAHNNTKQHIKTHKNTHSTTRIDSPHKKQQTSFSCICPM